MNTKTMNTKKKNNGKVIVDLSQKREICGYLMTTILVLFMVSLSIILEEKEIIFPEITAIAVGALVSPKLSWKTTGVRMIGLIGCAAVFGLFMAWLPLNLWIKIVMAFVVCQMIYLYSGTTFAPLISAAILPVLMGTKVIIYPISAICFTGIIVICKTVMEWILERKTRNENTRDRKYDKTIEIKKKGEKYIPVEKPDLIRLRQAGLRVVLVSIFALIALELGMKFLIAPPLLVAFMEFTNVECKARKQPVKIVGVLTICAFAGCISRWIIVEEMNGSLVIAACVATVILLGIIKWTGVFLPPAGALTILPMIISAGDILLYPVEIFIGSCVFMGLALMFFCEPKIQRKVCCSRNSVLLQAPKKITAKMILLLKKQLTNV